MTTRNKPLILVVDDESNFIEIISTKLGSAGFDVVSASSGAEAVLQAEKLMPDLTLMDISMPGQTGTDAALAIKQNPKTKNIKIVFLTGMSDPWPAVNGDKKKLALALGMEDFIEKTEDLDSIVDKVRSVLTRN